MSKRVPKCVPQQIIYWIVGHLHVSTPDSKIEADIRGRGFTQPITGKPATEKQIKACVKYALDCHHRNQELYRKVVSGRIR